MKYSVTDQPVQALFRDNVETAPQRIMQIVRHTDKVQQTPARGL